MSALDLGPIKARLATVRTLFGADHGARETQALVDEIEAWRTNARALIAFVDGQHSRFGDGDRALESMRALLHAAPEAP